MRTLFLMLLSVPAVVSQPSRAQSGRTCSVSGKVTFETPDKSLRINDLVVYVLHKNPKMKLAERSVHEMAQLDETFVPRLLVVQTNDSVSFPNLDRKDHSVFTRDLTVNIAVSDKLNPKPTVFPDENKLLRIQCSIHDKMKAWVVVVPMRNFATQVHQDGTWQIDGLPEGVHTLRVIEPNKQSRDFKVTACDTDTVEVSLTGKPGPRPPRPKNDGYLREFQ